MFLLQIFVKFNTRINHNAQTTTAAKVNNKTTAQMKAAKMERSFDTFSLFRQQKKEEESLFRFFF